MGLDWQSLNVRPIAVLFNQSFSLEDQSLGLIMKNMVYILNGDSGQLSLISPQLE